MENVVITLNVGDYLDAHVRASFQHAAARWGAHYIEFRRPWGRAGADDPFGAKLELDLLPEVHVGPDDQVLWLDGDVLIRADCPNLFEIVQATHFAGVCNDQGDTHVAGTASGGTHEPWWEQVNRTLQSPALYDPATYLNGGLLLFSPRRHGRLWAWIRQREAGRFRRPVNPMVEQTAMNIAIADQAIELHILPREFARLGAAAWRSGPAMTCWGYHLANLGGMRGSGADKARVLRSIDWRLVP